MIAPSLTTVTVPPCDPAPPLPPTVGLIEVVPLRLPVMAKPPLPPPPPIDWARRPTEWAPPVVIAPSLVTVTVPPDVPAPPAPPKVGLTEAMPRPAPIAHPPSPPPPPRLWARMP